MTNHPELLLEGGSRSGKTFILVYAILVRMIKYPGSRHLSVRLRFNHIKTSIWYDTLPKVIKVCFPNIQFKPNKADWFIEHPNGSQYWFGGLDDKERIEKILGNEYATIHLNEASQIAYNGYDIVKSRLNPPKGMKGMLLIDYNPPSVQHWGYKIFHEKVDYITGEPINNPDRYACLRMNPEDNLDNLSDDYLETLNSMSEKNRKRFLKGEYSDGSEYALWKWEWIANNRAKDRPDCDRVIIGVDPAVSNTDKSDDTGIVVVGKKNGHYYVFNDHTYSGSVVGWGQEVAKLYDYYQADRVIGEVNNGGDLVEVNIRNYSRNISYDSVRATRGKELRAEPIADLYRRGLVHHCGEFQELELQMTNWEPGEGSPDNMDALVWALTYISASENYSGDIYF